MAGFAWFRVLAVLTLLAPLLGSLRAETLAVQLFAEPTKLSFRVGLLERDEPVEILQLRHSWALVRQGDAIGWAPIDKVEESFEVQWSSVETVAPLLFTDRASRLDPSSPQSWSDHINGLLEFAAGNTGTKRRMEELREGSRAPAVSSEWGPLFYRRTPYYYWKGIQLWEVLGDRLSLNLVKGKYNQRALFGGLWSDNLLDSVVASNRGVLGNRSIFGKGRNYFFELRYSF